MTFENSILTLLTWLPTLGAAILLATPKTSLNAIRWISLIVTTVVFALSLALWQSFDASNPGFQFVVNLNWIGESIGYRVGVDGISVLFVVLTALLMPAVVVASWDVATRVTEYILVFLVLATLLIGVFPPLAIHQREHGRLAHRIADALPARDVGGDRARVEDAAATEHQPPAPAHAGLTGRSPAAPPATR